MLKNTLIAPITPNPETLPALLTEKQTVSYLGVSLGYLRRARTEGATGARTPGPRFIRLQGDVRGGKNRGRILYPKSELDAWLAALERREVI